MSDIATIVDIENAAPELPESKYSNTICENGTLYRIYERDGKEYLSYRDAARICAVHGKGLNDIFEKPWVHCDGMPIRS